MTGVPRHDRPVAALDVDGVVVLDAPQVPVRLHTVSAYGRWRRDILVPEVAAARIARLEELFDCVWASSWSHAAHPALRAALALPERPWPWLGVQFGKVAAVRRYAAGRGFVVVDDGLDDLMEQPTPSDGLVVRVRPGRGIADVDPDRLHHDLMNLLRAERSAATSSLTTDTAGLPAASSAPSPHDPARPTEGNPMSVTGTWNLVIATPMGAQAAQLTLEESGAGFSGIASSDGESVTCESLVVDGGRVTWKQDVTKPFKTTVHFDLSVDGDSIAGTAKPGMFPSSKVTGTRV